MGDKRISTRFKKVMSNWKDKSKNKDEGYIFDEPDSEENLVLGENDKVMAGTLVKLVQRLTNERKADPDYVQAFLLTYHSFSSPEELLSLLFERYGVPKPRGRFDEAEYTRSKTIIQLRVINVLKYWLGNFKNDFGADDEATHRLLNFVDNNLVDPDAPLQALLQLKRILHLQLEENEQNAPIVDLSIINDDEGVAIVETRGEVASRQEPAQAVDYAESVAPSEFDPDEMSPSMSPLASPTQPRRGFLGWASRKSNEPSVGSMSSLLLAHQMALVDHEMYCAIPLREFIGQAWAKSDKQQRAPHVLALIARFNTVSSWVATEILHGGQRPKDRAAVLKKFIRVAHHLFQIQCYNGLMNVLAGLSASAIYRMKKTWAEVGDKQMAVYDELQSVMDPKGSFKRFRERIHNINPPCMPYMGIYLTDLTFTEDGNKDTTPAGLINFEKRRKIAKVIAEIKQYQQVRYSFPRNDNIINFLTNLPDGLAEAEQHKMSLAIEPREPK